jgi:hypothetical protein
MRKQQYVVGTGSGPNSRVAWGLVMVVLVGAVLAFTHGTAGNPPGSRAGSVSPGGKSPAPTSTTPGMPETPQYLTARFLAVYWSWSATQTMQGYIASWRPMVTEGALIDLEQASPRLTLDGGNESAARSVAPTIAAGAVQQFAGDQAEVAVSWTIQVLRAGDGALWMPLQVQAAVDLVQTSTGWLVSLLNWTTS